MDAQATHLWKMLAHENNLLLERMKAKVTIQYTDIDPYETAVQMIAEVQNTGILKVYTGHSNHPAWSETENVTFRAVHDYYGHIVPNQMFGLTGEIEAALHHQRFLPAECWPALFTEVVMQSCYYQVHGNFPEQKIFIPKHIPITTYAHTA